MSKRFRTDLLDFIWRPRSDHSFREHNHGHCIPFKQETAEELHEHLSCQPGFCRYPDGIACHPRSRYILYGMSIHYNKALLVYWWYKIRSFPSNKIQSLAITYDRYLAVLRPLQYQVKMTGKRVISILLLAWTLPIVLAVLRNAWQHTSSPEKSLYVDRIYSTVLIFAFVVVPVVLMVIVNILIVQAIRRQRRAEDNRAKLLRRNRGTCYIGHKENWNERRLKHKGTVSCILIVLIFVVCWIPRAFYNFSHVFGRPDLVSPLLEKLSLFFLFLQSAVNPAIYSYYRDDFKKALLDLLSRT